MFSLPSNHAFCKKYTIRSSDEFFYFAIILFSFLFHGSIPFSETLGQGSKYRPAEFVFQVIDKNTVHWSNGVTKATISVPVRNGYLVLLGGQNERITDPIVSGKIQALFRYSRPEGRQASDLDPDQRSLPMLIP